MKKIRIGNDIQVQWSLLSKGTLEPFNIEGKKISLYLKTPFGKQVIEDFVVELNTIKWTFYGKSQHQLGAYSLVVCINENEPAMMTTDVCNFVQLVSTSSCAGGDDEQGVATEYVELETIVNVKSEISDADLSEYLTKKEAQESYQPKEAGKGLSSNDYTDLDKEKLNTLEKDVEILKEQGGSDIDLSDYLTREEFNEVSERFASADRVQELSENVTELSAEVGKKQDTISDLETIRSGATRGATAIQEVKTINGQSIVGSGNIEIQGGSGGGMTTPSGDPMHYMYEAVGAEWNGTGADIEKQGVYGDSYVHKAKHWNLNELGDITNEEMRQIYLYANLDNGAKGATKYLAGIETRTNIATWSSSWNGKIKDQEAFAHADKVIVARMRNKEHYIDTNASFTFTGCTALQKILPTLDATSTTSFNGAFDHCKNLREVRIKNAKVAIKFNASPLISKASILYLIQNSAATSAMVITLHADAYARLAEDADIVAALAEKTNVSLAK